ncbi:HPP family protein [Pseudonocardia hispaniensis]|uniref:HPP family protein n=1 Tax=Pseudonocardia hispaniensis TaxID=904933 RepID=A0ABW1J2W0_9PSEU
MSAYHTRLGAPPETLDDDPPLAALMTRRLVGVTSDTDAFVALGLMARTGVRHLPVIDHTGCRGLVLERDLLAHIPANMARYSSTPPLVAALCRSAPTLHTTDRRSAAAERMHVTGVDAVLVTEGEQLVGLVTATDLIRSLAEATAATPPG